MSDIICKTNLNMYMNIYSPAVNDQAAVTSSISPQQQTNIFFERCAWLMQTILYNKWTVIQLQIKASVVSSGERERDLYCWNIESETLYERMKTTSVFDGS